MASLKVAVRVRPLNHRELNLNCSTIISMQNNNTLISNNCLKLSTHGAIDTLSKDEYKQFTFDHSYWSVNPEDSHYTTQEKIFEDLGHDVVQSAYEGYNACVFAYGQTGSGKTHTMMGSVDNVGLIPRICESLFTKMRGTEVTYRTEVSYLEIYNERVRDLLRESKESQTNLRVREHPKEGPYVQGLSQHLVVDYEHVENLIVKGNTNRTTAMTNMNDVSSRSHAIFTIFFTQARFCDGTPSEIHSKIHLVDLAGSERSDIAGTVGERLKEGASINKSLVTLGNVISALAERSSSRESGATKQHFIPYRDSTLTWLLKDSLGGNSKTIMIATISPANCNYAETMSTLRYANRAKNIVNKPTVNEDPNVRLIRELRKENARLRDLLAETGSSGAQEQLNRNEQMVKQLTEMWTDKWLEAAQILKEHHMLALRKEGMGVILDSDLPYLLVLNDNILSTGMKLYHLKEGETRVGREDAGNPQDIELFGARIEAEHCVIKHYDDEVELVPLDGALCTVNNVCVGETTKLSQGAIIRLGRDQLFRFNHPHQAAQLRREFGASHTSQLSGMLRDVEWTCSVMSFSDSALGSDLDLRLDQKPLCEGCERLQERRQELDVREAEHCLAEAKRLALLAEQESHGEELAQTQRDVESLADEASSMKQQAQQANEEIGKLSERFESELKQRLDEVARLAEARHDLDGDLVKLVAESELVATARSSQREESARLQQAQCELAEERRAQEAELHRQQERLDRSQTLERDIYKQSMAEMRALVSAEVRDMHRLAGCVNGDVNRDVNGDVNSDDTDTANSSFDLDELRLQFDLEESSVPYKYLERSDTVDSSVDSDVDLEADWSADEVGCRAAELCQRAHAVHRHVCDVLTRKYASVLSSDDDTAGLTATVDAEVGRLRPVFQKLQQLCGVGSGGVCLAAQLTSCADLLTAVQRLLQTHTLLQRGDALLREQSFLPALDALSRVQALTSGRGDEAATAVGGEWWEEGSGRREAGCAAGEEGVLKALRTEQCVLRERLHQSVAETWTAAVQCGARSLRLWRAPARRALLASAAAALQHARMLDVRLRALADAIIETCVDPALRFAGATLRTEPEADGAAVLRVTVPGDASPAPVTPADAMEKLATVFTFVHASLAAVPLADSATLTQELGRTLVERHLLTRIHDDCLAPALPRSRHQWAQFSRVLSFADAFHATLAALDFVAPGQPTLLHHLQGANCLFANAKGQHTLHCAHQLMTAALEPTLAVCTEQPLGGSTGEQYRDAELARFIHECRKETGTVNYKLPKCLVSVCVVQLVLLAYDAVHDAVRAAYDCASQLHASTCAVFQLYCDVVPPFHADKLSSTPLLAALHHNNCMYIAQHLITIDKAFQAKFSQLPAGVVGGQNDLGRLISKVKRLGNEAFSEHIAVKRAQLSQHLGGVDVLECIADDDGAGATIAITHMLQHLQHISATWWEVLPIHVYCKAVGSLLHSTVCSLIASVLSLEEFSADDCDHLQQCLSLVVAAGPKYFSVLPPPANPHVMLHENVATWGRLKELAALFGAGLRELSDRWSDGKGPLALHFSASEVRRLVVAIFEDTRKRDALLAQLR